MTDMGNPTARGIDRYLESTAIGTTWSGYLNKGLDAVDKALVRISIARVADFTALAALDATAYLEGDLVYVVEGSVHMRRLGTTWVQLTASTFATAAARNTAYAKASAAYRLPGARAILNSADRAETIWTGTRWIFDGLTAGVVPTGSAVAGGTISIDDRGVAVLSDATSWSLYGVFSADWPHYRVRVIGEATGAATIDMRLVSGTTENTAAYRRQRLSGVGSTASSLYAGDASSLVVSATSGVGRHDIGIEVNYPTSTIDTSGRYESAFTDNPMTAASAISSGAWQHENSSAFDGIRFVPTAGVFSGSCWVERIR